MLTAPVLSSIISPGFLLEFTQKMYDVNTLTNCKILKTGINHTYLLSNRNHKYILRVYFVDWRTEEEINEELKLITFLNQKNISVSIPIKDKKGTYVQTISAAEGERFMVLFTYADGDLVRIPSPDTCYSIGKAIGKMHLLTENKIIKRKHYNSETLVNWAYDLSIKHFSENLKEIKYFKRSVSRIKNDFRNINPLKVRYGVIHLDLWYENMKIKDDSTITIFDFDNCGNGWLFLDIAYTLMLLYRNEADKDLFIKKRNSFLEGYESITPITKEEKRLLPLGGLAVWLHYTGIHVLRFNDFSNQFLSNEFLKYWIQTVDQWMLFNNIEI